MPESDASATQAAQVTKKGQFLVVNASELLERLAYYGIVSVTTLYLASLGYSKLDLGFLVVLLLGLPYVVPILTGPVAEKVGYKPVMLAAFVLYAAGFLFLASFTTLSLLATGLVLLAFGAGMFKPLTAASIGHVTSLEHRSLGFNLYYIGINIGGFLGPVLLAFIGGQYRLAFLLGAGIMAADFLLVAALFRNPVPPQPETRVLRSFRPLGEVLLNGRFMLLLLIFAGFWFLYVMNFSFLTLYLDRFVPKPDWFDANLQQAIDPLFVVILGIPLGNVAAKRNPVRMMALGIALSVAGFLLLGFVPQFWALVAGIIVSTAGEVLAYPGFLAYVSRIAPKDRVAVYQGFGFLPIFAGFTLGPIVGGALYGSIAEGAGRPAFFWALMAAVPILSIVAFLLYARAQEPREARTRRGLAAPVLALLLVPLVALAGLAAGTAASLHSAAEPTGPLLLGDAVGTATEGQTVERTLSVPAGALGNVTLAFRWSDTTPSTPPGATNQPDTFQVTVLDALGERQTQKGSGGALGFAFPLRAGGGNLTVRLTLTDAGDVVLATPGGAVPVAPDTTADWSYTARLKPA